MTELELKHLASERMAKLNAEQRILLSESTSASFASPNKTVIQTPEYFDNILYGVEPMSSLWFELVQVKGSAEYSEWMKINSPLEWYGEFRRTRHEQINIESYNEKDLV